MLPRLHQIVVKWVVALSVVLWAAGAGVGQADDGGFLGRLFRLGSGSPASESSSSAPSPTQGGTLPYGHPPDGTGAPAPAGTSPLGSPAALPGYGGLPQNPATPPLTPSEPAQRVVPRPRVSTTVTSADPLVTRIALGRSNDGSQFGMFLQVFTDGTVIDSEGVHRLRPSELKPIVAAAQSTDLLRARGHCGAPATDFVEHVHIIVYERRMGRLTAHALSYSGNPQGCDHAIRHLHTALENLQVKLSRQPVAGAPAASNGPLPMGTSGMPASGATAIEGEGIPAISPPAFNQQPPAPAPNPAGAPSGSVIPLSPPEPSH
jgi:hypothetical protein